MPIGICRPPPPRKFSPANAKVKEDSTPHVVAECKIGLSIVVVSIDDSHIYHLFAIRFNFLAHY